jgi:hypothetical protein
LLTYDFFRALAVESEVEGKFGIEQIMDDTVEDLEDVKE